MPLGTPQDIRLLQSLESSLPLIDSPAPGPGVAPMTTYSDSISNSYCTSFMSVRPLRTSVRCFFGREPAARPTLTCCAAQVRGRRRDQGRWRLRQRGRHRLSRPPGRKWCLLLRHGRSARAQRWAPLRAAKTPAPDLSGVKACDASLRGLVLLTLLASGPIPTRMIPTLHPSTSTVQNPSLGQDGPPAPLIH